MSAKNSRKNGGASPLPFVLFGTLMGYLLSKARATDYDAIASMLTFDRKDLQLWGVLAVALALAALGFLVMRLKGLKNREGDRFAIEGPSFEMNRLAGGLLFGAGWALCGACPTTALAQLGEGKFVAVFTVIGILAGVWLYEKFMEESEADCD